MFNWRFWIDPPAINTIFDANQSIRRKFSDSTVHEDMHHWSFKVIQ
jgi:hypothetical protein